MAPGLPDLDAVRAVCSAVGKPFNFMVGIKGKSFTVAALADAGVKRISLATSLYQRGDDRTAERGQGGARAWYVRLYRHLARHSRHERISPRLTGAAAVADRGSGSVGQRWCRNFARLPTLGPDTGALVRR